MIRQMLFCGAMAFAFHSMAATLLEADFTGDEAALQALQFSGRNVKLSAGEKGGVVAAKAGEYAEYSCPAGNRFDPAGGVIALELAPEVDTASFEGQENARSMTIFAANGDQKLNQSLTVGAVLHGKYQIIGINYNNGKQKIAKHLTINWKKGEPHFVVIKFDNATLTGMVDGKEFFTEKLDGSMFMPGRLSACGYNNSVFSVRKLTVRDNKE